MAALDSTTQQKIKEKMRQVQEESRSLEAETKARGKIQINYPPIRGLNKVALDTFNEEQSGKQAIKKERIKSQEYDKWNKFDADAECVKIDLHEELEQERLNKLKRELQEIPEIEEIQDDVIKQLTPKEREVLARRHRECGNDYFRGREYDHAITQYNTSLRLHPQAATYNNRAITYLKQKKYKDALEDCEKCLSMEPENVKALLRKAQAYQGMLWRQEAYDVYCHVLRLDRNNSFAHEQVAELRHQLPKLPPPNATRIKIVEDNVESVSSSVTRAAEAGVKAKENVAPDHVEVVKDETQTTKLVKKPKSPVKAAKETDAKEDPLENYKKKMKEQKAQKEKFKEQMQQMICDDVFLLPHHDKRQKEFIIAESKD